MRIKKKKVGMALILVVLIAFQSLLPVVNFNIVNAQSDGEKINDVQLDLTAFVPSNDKWDSSDYKIWFGRYNNIPTAYRALKYDETNKHLLLDCDTVLDNPSIYTGTNEWEGSGLQSFLNNKNTADNFNYNYRSIAEREEKAVAISIIPAKGQYEFFRTYTYYFFNNYVENPYFTLAVDEVQKLYKDNNARKKTGASDLWWLRSQNSSPVNLGIIRGDGSIDVIGSGDSSVGVSPAFNIKEENVLFAFPKGYEKAQSLSKIGKSNSKEWILTVLDSGVFSAIRQIDSGEPQNVAPGGTIKINVSEIDTSKTYTQISAMLFDKNNNLIYYGKIKDEATTGESNITIPSDITLVQENYTLKVFAEDINATETNFLTDYASTVVEIPLVIEPIYNIDITKGQGVTASGTVNPNQSIIGGKYMETATYEVTDGYYFPIGYGFEQNGIFVGRIDDKRVSVAGIPVDNCQITICAEKVSDRVTPIAKRNINFGAKTLITLYDNEPAMWTVAEGAKLYYGKFNGTDGTLYRVLEADDKVAFLDCNSLIHEMRMNNYNPANPEQKSGYINEYSGSDLHKWLNGNGFLNNTGVFSTTEKTSILKTSLSQEENYSFDEENNPGKDYASLDYIFPLSTRNIMTYYYRVAYENISLKKLDSNGDGWDWWLRTSSLINNIGNYMIIHKRNNTINRIANVNSRDLSPAFQIDLSSVLFTTALGTDKSSFSNVTNDNISSNTWEFTMQATKENINVALASNNEGKTRLKTDYTDQTYLVSHLAAETVLPDATQISAAFMSVDSLGNDADVLHYGKVSSNLTDTTTNVLIPAGLAEGTYNLYLFAEDVNENTQTDYACALGNPIVIKVSDTVISTDISWGSMEFTYNDGIWNTETHIWEGMGWEPSDTDFNKITVQNNSNVDLNVLFSYTKKDGFSDLDGNFTDNVNDITNPLPILKTEEKSVYLDLIGSMDRTTDYNAVGTITVTLTANEGDE